MFASTSYQPESPEDRKDAKSGFGYVEFEDLWGIYLKCHLAFDLGKSGGQN